jgi:hypothetical protein
MNKIRHFFSPTQESFQPDGWVEQLHRGALLVLRANEESSRLVQLARECITQVTGDASVDARGLFRSLPYETVKQIRHKIYEHPKLWQSAREILLSHQMPSEVRLDIPRLRVITHGDEEKREADAVYVMHRDTWYGCPQDQLNWWMPLFDTPIEQAFGFFPAFFLREVPNGSAGFEYEAWMKKVGWHGKTDVSEYPQPEEVVSKSDMLRFDFHAGDVLVFAAHQLHQTQPNTIEGTARWSLDFRSTNHSASSPNVDNRSQGAELRAQREFFSVGADRRVAQSS